MNSPRIMLATFVNLDPLPGAFHTADSARSAVNNILKQQIPHYLPIVSVMSYGRQFHKVTFDHNNENYASNPEYNMVFVKGVINHLNAMLIARGYLFLNEAYAALGVQPIREGQIVGWTDGPISWDPQYKENGDVDIMFFTVGSIIDTAFADRDEDGS